MVKRAIVLLLGVFLLGGCAARQSAPPPREQPKAVRASAPHIGVVKDPVADFPITYRIRTGGCAPATTQP